MIVSQTLSILSGIFALALASAQTAESRSGEFCSAAPAVATSLLQRKVEHKNNELAYESEATVQGKAVCGHECSMEFVKREVAPLTLVTIAFHLPDAQLAWLRRNRRREARAFGYEYCVYANPDCLPQKQGGDAWAKVAATRLLLQGGRKVVAVVDGDALIINPTPFDPIVGPHFLAGKSIVFSKDCENTGLWPRFSPIHTQHHPPKVLGGLNTGVYVTTNDTWAQDFWTRIWGATCHLNCNWWEQGVVLEYQSEHPEEFDLHTVRLDTHAMNSCNGSYRHGDFMFHGYDLYDLNFTERLEYMQKRFG